jgi:hypothetical protein
MINIIVGWGYMADQGATTLWERWTGSQYDQVDSWNHIMFGSQACTHAHNAATTPLHYFEDCLNLLCFIWGKYDSYATLS